MYTWANTVRMSTKMVPASRLWMVELQMILIFLYLLIYIFWICQNEDVITSAVEPIPLQEIDNSGGR